MVARLRCVLLGWLGARLLQLLNHTLVWQVDGTRAPPQWCSGAYVLAFWHSDQLLMPFLVKRVEVPGAPRPATMISEHGDGRIIAEVIRSLGFPSIAGSSTRGGKRAFLKMIRRLHAGAPVAITPDGPRGPVGVLKPGVIDLALHGQVPIYPVVLRASKAWYFGSWDKMYLPKPGARMLAVVGAPWYVPQGTAQEGRERLRIDLEATMQELRHVADRTLAIAPL